MVKFTKDNNPNIPRQVEMVNTHNKSKKRNNKDNGKRAKKKSKKESSIEVNRISELEDTVRSLERTIARAEKQNKKHNNKAEDILASLQSGCSTNNSSSSSSSSSSAPLSLSPEQSSKAKGDVIKAIANLPVVKSPEHVREILNYLTTHPIGERLFKPCWKCRQSNFTI